MRQITDARAPFPDIDTAAAVGIEYLDEMGGWPIDAVPEPQHGGYYVRISWSTPAGGSRHKRNHRHINTAEIGRIFADEVFGTDEGQLCRRDGCCGRIEFTTDGPCCCGAVRAPCSACEGSYLRCPECDWDNREDVR